MKIRFYENWIMEVGKFFNRVGDAIQWIGVFLYFKRQGARKDIDEQLPPTTWPEHEPWHDNFSTREGEHEHV